MDNNNELCLAGEITEIIVNKPRVKSFVLKSKGFEMLCTAFTGAEISLNDITTGKKCYVQGIFKARRWTNSKGNEIIENQFIINKII